MCIFDNWEQSGVSPLKMAADAGWSTFASDVQQLLGLSSTGQSKLQVMSPLDPSPVPQQRPAFSLASPALLQLSETQRIEVRVARAALHEVCDVFFAAISAFSTASFGRFFFVVGSTPRPMPVSAANFSCTIVLRHYQSRIPTA
jgi:hypothetical protein